MNDNGRRMPSASSTSAHRRNRGLSGGGKTSKAIARAVNLSPGTVEMHRARMMKKFGAATTLELAYRLASAAAPET